MLAPGDRQGRRAGDSEYLRDMPERRRRRDSEYSLSDEARQLCHFHFSFHAGYLDVLAEDFVFLIVSR